MFKHLSDMQKVSVYTALVFIFVAMLILLPIKQSSLFFMFVPLVSVLITMLLTGEAFTKTGWKQLGFHRFHSNTFFLSLVIPMIPIMIGYTLVWMTGLGTFGIADEYKGKEMVLVVGFFMTLIISSLTVTLGEEIGWRGYMASKLKRLGLAKALLLNGLIWGLFHLPIILFTDVYHADVNLFAFIPLFLATVTLAGAFMTYVRYASGSIWPAIIAHTAHNLMWNYGELFTREPHSLVTYITGDAGLVLIVFYLILFIWIVTKKKGHPLL